jgi:hypothetical protein
MKKRSRTKKRKEVIWKRNFFLFQRRIKILKSYSTTSISKSPNTNSQRLLESNSI